MKTRARAHITQRKEIEVRRQLKLWYIWIHLPKQAPNHCTQVKQNKTTTLLKENQKQQHKKWCLKNSTNEIRIEANTQTLCFDHFALFIWRVFFYIIRRDWILYCIDTIQALLSWTYVSCDGSEKSRCYIKPGLFPSLRSRTAFVPVASVRTLRPWRWQFFSWRARCTWRHRGWHSPGTPWAHHESLRRSSRRFSWLLHDVLVVWLLAWLSLECCHGGSFDVS